jgi:branched-subunit amino acid ABC-type transport system permease component
LIDIIILGAISSFIYALFALGFSLIYGVSGMVNLTHGAFYMIGAYIYSGLVVILSQNIPPQLSYLTPVMALILSPMITGIIGSIYYRLILHQILGDEVATMVTSICGCLIFQQLIFIYLGSILALHFPVPTLLPGISIIANIRILNGRLLAALTSIIVFIALAIFIAKTKIGKAMRALSQDLEASMLMGISVEKLYMLTTAISAGFACIAGIMFTTSTTGHVTAYAWLEALAISFAIVILGGLGSIKGTLIGAIIFGYAGTIITSMLPQGGMLMQSFPFIVMISVLIIRPKGLFGKRIEME